MAIAPKDTYTNVDDPGATYPYGRAANETSPGALDGSPFEKAWLNDLWGWQQRLLVLAGIAPSADPEEAEYGNSQYLQAMAEILSRKKFTHKDDAGNPSTTAAFHLIPNSVGPEVSQDVDSMEITLIAPQTNAGALTVSVDGSANRAVVTENAAALAGGEIVQGDRIRLVYDEANTRYVLEPWRDGMQPARIVALASASETLLAMNIGALHLLGGSVANVTTPAIAGVDISEGYYLTNNLATGVTMNRDGASTFVGVPAFAGSSTAFVLPPYCSVFVYKSAAATWQVVGLPSAIGISRKAKPATQVYTADGVSYTFAHSFGVIPDYAILKMIVKAGQTDGGYTAGEEIIIPLGRLHQSANTGGLTAKLTTANVILYVDADGIGATSTSFGGFTMSTASKWDMQMIIFG